METEMRRKLQELTLLSEKFLTEALVLSARSLEHTNRQTEWMERMLREDGVIQ